MLILSIYLYMCVCRGDRAFCSVECRYRQIFMDEEESCEKSGCTLEYTCSAAATSSPSSSSPASSRSGKGGRARANAFAYWRMSVFFRFCPPFLSSISALPRVAPGAGLSSHVSPWVFGFPLAFFRCRRNWGICPFFCLEFLKLKGVFGSSVFIYLRSF